MIAFGATCDALHAHAKTLRKQIDFQEDNFNSSAADPDRIYRIAVRVIAITGTMAVLLAIAAALLITRSVVRALDRAVKVARTVGSGDLTSRSEIQRNDEAAQRR